jgi:hypothetical protein
MVPTLLSTGMSGRSRRSIQQLQAPENRAGIKIRHSLNPKSESNFRHRTHGTPAAIYSWFTAPIRSSVSVLSSDPAQPATGIEIIDGSSKTLAGTGRVRPGEYPAGYRVMFEYKETPPQITKIEAEITGPVETSLLPVAQPVLARQRTPKAYEDVL